MKTNETVKSISKTNNKKEVRYSVEEISNGWILCKNVSGTDAKGNYTSDTVKTYFKTNPLDDSVIAKTDKIKQALGKTDEDGDEVVS